MRHNGVDQGSFNFQAETAAPRLAAQRALVAAESLARTGGLGVDAAFNDAKFLATKAASPELQMRAHYSHAEWLAKQGAFREARSCFSIAERNAWLIDKDPEEKLARIRLAIIEMEIEAAEDSGLKLFFNNFKIAATSCSNSWDERHGVWLGFIEDLNGSSERLAARKFGSEEDFRSRLQAIKQK